MRSKHAAALLQTHHTGLPRRFRAASRLSSQCRPSALGNDRRWGVADRHRLDLARLAVQAQACGEECTALPLKWTPQLQRRLMTRKIADTSTPLSAVRNLPTISSAAARLPSHKPLRDWGTSYALCIDSSRIVASASDDIMAQQQAAQQVAKLLSRVGRWSIVLGVGGSALQASLYTGACNCAVTWSMSPGLQMATHAHEGHEQMHAIQSSAVAPTCPCLARLWGCDPGARHHPRPALRLQLSCMRAVDGGERAVMYDRLQGVLPQPIGEGTHFRVPWFQTPNVMDIRTRPRSISSVTGTKGPRDRRPTWT